MSEKSNKIPFVDFYIYPFNIKWKEDGQSPDIDGTRFKRICRFSQNQIANFMKDFESKQHASTYFERGMFFNNLKRLASSSNPEIQQFRVKHCNEKFNDSIGSMICYHTFPWKDSEELTPTCMIQIRSDKWDDKEPKWRPMDQYADPTILPNAWKKKIFPL